MVACELVCLSKIRLGHTSGIVLPDTAKEKLQSAEVVSVGAHEDVKVSVGDVVVVRKYSGTEVKLDGEDHRIVEAEDILGVVEG
jgi:chaperonin GroES